MGSIVRRHYTGTAGEAISIRVPVYRQLHNPGLTGRRARI